jgi:hypothetical protein
MRHRGNVDKADIVDERVTGKRNIRKDVHTRRPGVGAERTRDILADHQSCNSSVASEEVVRNGEQPDVASGQAFETLEHRFEYSLSICTGHDDGGAILC